MCYMQNHQKLLNLAEYRMLTSLLATQGFLRGRCHLFSRKQMAKTVSFTIPLIPQNFGNQAQFF